MNGNAGGDNGTSLRRQASKAHMDNTENLLLRAARRLQRFLGAFCLLMLCGLAVAGADAPASVLPENFESWQAQGSTQPATPAQVLAPVVADSAQFKINTATARLYISSAAEPLRITHVQTETETGAYALFTAFRRSASSALNRDVTPVSVGTAGLTIDGRTVFFKGNAVVVVEPADGKQLRSETLVVEAARAFAQTLDGGENEIPVLVKHIPDWEATQNSIVYAVSLAGLQKELGTAEAELFDGLDFGGGTEAVIAPYDNGQTRLIVIEQTTPQLAAANNAYLAERVLRFRQEGKSVPAAFRREGNYLVFVLGQADEQAANQLLGQVKYEQLVRWLGDNPRAFDIANRRYAETTANVIITTLKATGLSLILCLGVGALFGGAVFLRRRSQQVVSAQFSDAGGMVRLNLEEATTSTSKLLGKSNK